MARPSISVGDDTPSGEPDTAPRGPYITDRSDGSERTPSGLPKGDAGRRVPRRAAGKANQQTARR